MGLDDPQAREQVLLRLRRLEGQVRGVQNMIAEDRDCTDVLQQMAAIRSAVQGATMLMLESYIDSCLVERSVENNADRRKLVEELLFFVGKVPSSS